MKIKEFNVSKSSRALIITELSANHNGSLEIALETVRAARRAGADCLNFKHIQLKQ